MAASAYGADSGSSTFVQAATESSSGGKSRQRMYGSPDGRGRSSGQRSPNRESSGGIPFAGGSLHTQPSSSRLAVEKALRGDREPWQSAIAPPIRLSVLAFPMLNAQGSRYVWAWELCGVVVVAGTVFLCSHVHAN